MTREEIAMTKKVRLELELGRDEAEGLIRALEATAWMAGEAALEGELSAVARLDWLVGQIRAALGPETVPAAG